jgi:hypothetical protein
MSLVTRHLVLRTTDRDVIKLGMNSKFDKK